MKKKDFYHSQISETKFVRPKFLIYGDINANKTALQKIQTILSTQK